MSLGNFISFDDDDEVVAPTPKPKKRKRNPPGPPRPPKPIKKVEEVKEVEVEKVEEVGIITDVDNTQTKITLKRHFENKKILGKETFNAIYKGKKTLLGSIIRPTDKIVEVCLVDAENAGTCRFISIRFKSVAERELTKVSKQYMSLDNSRRVPALVELKYMNNSLYETHRQKIVDQFA